MILRDSECEFSWCKTHYSVNMHWKILFFTSFDYKPIPVAELFKARVCGRSLAGIVGSNPAGVMHICVMCGIFYSKKKRKMPGQSRPKRSKKNTSENMRRSSGKNVPMGEWMSVSCEICFSQTEIFEHG